MFAQRFASGPHTHFMLYLLVMPIALCGCQFTTAENSILVASVKPVPVKKTVLVAKMDLDIGTFLGKPEALFEKRSVVSEKLPKDVVTSFEQLRGKYLTCSLEKGDQIEPSNLVDLSPNNPKGLRAVKTYAEMEVFGSGPPINWRGLRVDVLWFTKDSKKGESQCWTLLENVLVLNDPEKNPRDRGPERLPDYLFVFCVNPQQFQDLQRVKGKGSLQVVLRRADDEPKRETTVKELLKRLKRTHDDGKAAR